LIEIVRHIFACKVSYDPNTVKRHAARSGALRHSTGFHFHCTCPISVQAALFLRGPRHMINGTNHTNVMPAASGRVQSREGLLSRHNGGANHHIGDPQFRSQRAAKSGADNCLRRKTLHCSIHCESSLPGAGSVGRQHQLVVAKARGAGPIDRETRRGQAGCVRHDAGKLHGVRRYHEDSHHAAGLWAWR
jgi:hypothetical protein